MLRPCSALSLCLLGGGAVAQPASPFLIGAEWKDDASQAVKDLFWETGCNFARVTGGGYAWAVDAHKHAMAELNEHGIRVLLQLGSHYPSADFFDFKDAYFVDQNGKSGVPSRKTWAVEYDDQTWPQYSYASERFRNELEKDFTAYFDALGPLKNVEALLLHNEPGYLWLEKRIFDYSASSIERFREWLPSQHATIADLNRRWGTAFESFEKVEPPREIPPVQNPAAWMDWRRFNVASIRDFLKWEREFAQRVRPGTAATTNLAGPIDDWFPIRLADNYGFSQEMDIASVDIYPGSEWSSRFMPGYTMDMTRGAASGKRIFVAECESYAAARFPKLNDDQRTERLASDLWSYIGHGANGILVWTLNGEEGFRLTDGEFNGRIGALRETAHVAKMLNLGDFRKPLRKVALVVDQNAPLLPEGLDPHARGSVTYRTALGVYGALAQAHVEVDVVDVDMVRKGACDGYKALVLAQPAVMDAPLAQRLKALVEAGGLIVADTSVATCDRWGKPLETRPGLGLNALFGAQVRSTDAGSFEVRAGGTTFHGQGRGRLELHGAEILCRFADGEPAAVRRQTGKGSAILLATDVGGLNAMTAETGLSEAVGGWIAKYAGVSPDIEIANADGFLDVMRLTDAKGNGLAVISNPPNQADAPTPYRNVGFKLAGVPTTAARYLLLPATQANGRTLAGPRRLASDVVPNLVSYAAILTAHDHGPLLATDSPLSVAAGSKTEIRVTVFNPSPRPLAGLLKLVLPKGWGEGASASVDLGPFAQKTILLAATAGPPSKRAVLKAALTANDVEIESVPFDVEVR